MIGSLLLFLLSPNIWGGAYGAIRIASFLLLVMLAVRLVLTLRLERLFPDMLVEGLRKGDFKTRVRTMALMDELKYMRHNRLGAVLDVLRDETGADSAAGPADARPPARLDHLAGNRQADHQSGPGAAAGSDQGDR